MDRTLEREGHLQLESITYYDIHFHRDSREMIMMGDELTNRDKHQTTPCGLKDQPLAGVVDIGRTYRKGLGFGS